MRGGAGISTMHCTDAYLAICFNDSDSSSECSVVAKRHARTANLADEFVRVRGVGKQDSTLAIYDKAKGNLTECFGDLPIEEFRVKHGREFWRWLIEDKQYSENTAKQSLR